MTSHHWRAECDVVAARTDVKDNLAHVHTTAAAAVSPLAYPNMFREQIDANDLEAVLIIPRPRPRNHSLRPAFRSHQYPPFPVLARLSSLCRFPPLCAISLDGFQSLYLALVFARLSVLLHLILLTECEHEVRRFFESLSAMSCISGDASSPAISCISSSGNVDIVKLVQHLIVRESASR